MVVNFIKKYIALVIQVFLVVICVWVLISHEHLSEQTKLGYQVLLIISIVGTALKARDLYRNH